MSFIFTGVAINKKFNPKKIDSFAFRFGCNSLKFDKELTFEESLDMDYEDEYLDFIFFKNSTFVLIPIEYAINLKVGKASFKCETLFFTTNEVSMSMWMYYYKHLQTIKISREVNLKIEKDYDKDFDIPYEDTSDLIFKMIERICKKSFWDIDNETKVYRFRPTNKEPKLTFRDIRWIKAHTKYREKLRDQKHKS